MEPSEKQYMEDLKKFEEENKDEIEEILLEALRQADNGETISLEECVKEMEERYGK